MPLLTIGTSLRQTADGEHNLRSLVTVDFVGLLVQDQGAGNKDPSDEMQNTLQKRKKREITEKKGTHPSQAAFIFTSQLCYLHLGVPCNLQFCHTLLTAELN